MAYRAVATTAMRWFDVAIASFCGARRLRCRKESHVINVARYVQMRSADMRCSYSADPSTLRDGHEDWMLPGDRALHCSRVSGLHPSLPSGWCLHGCNVRHHQSDNGPVLKALVDSRVFDVVDEVVAGGLRCLQTAPSATSRLSRMIGANPERLRST